MIPFFFIPSIVRNTTNVQSAFGKIAMYIKLRPDIKIL